MPQLPTPTPTLYARWTHTKVLGQIEPTMRFSLRAGAKGTGEELGAVQYWMDSARSMEEADTICLHIEARARADGYAILPDLAAIEA